MVIAGIDPGICNTAICHGSEETGGVVKSFPSKARGDALPNRFGRYVDVIGQIVALLDAVQPQVILIEGYSLGSKHRGEALAEFGSLLRWHALDYTPNVYEVAPLTLKKFATGAGKGQKDMMIAHVTQRWQRLFSTNDEVDAFALFQLALRVADVVEPTNKPERECVATVLRDRPLQLTTPAAHSESPAF